LHVFLFLYFKPFFGGFHFIWVPSFLLQKMFYKENRHLKFAILAQRGQVNNNLESKHCSGIVQCPTGAGGVKPRCGG
jgi:hypothetical protein